MNEERFKLPSALNWLRAAVDGRLSDGGRMEKLALKVIEEKLGELAPDEFGRPTFYLYEGSWYGMKARGMCTYATKEEAIKHAIWTANAFGMTEEDWAKFPDAGWGSYPYEDRTGFENPPLTPVFRARWPGSGGGEVTVTKVTVSKTFEAASGMEHTLAVLERLKTIKEG